MPQENTPINDSSAAEENKDDKNNAGDGDAGGDQQSSASDGDKNQNDQGQGDQGDTIDYKAELEKVTKQLGQAEHTIVELKDKNKSKDGAAEGDDSQAPQPNVAEVVDKKFDELRSDLLSDFITDTVNSFTDNADKQALILHHYNNSIKHSGSSKAQIQADLELAAAMADAPRIRKEHAEMQRTLAAKKTIQNTGGGSNQDHSGPELPDSKIPISEADKKFMESIGITTDDVKKNVTEGR